MPLHKQQMRTASPADIEAFVVKLRAKIDYHYKRAFPGNSPPVISTTRGPRYVRVVKTIDGSKSVYCFVEIGTGNILKAAGWKTPALHSRGNIFDESALECCGMYGVAHLR